MVVRSLEMSKDPFRPREENEELFGPEVPYLSAIGALMYLSNATRPDIALFINLLAKYCSSPTRRHWNEIKHILRYLKGTTDMRLFYAKKGNAACIAQLKGGFIKGDRTKHISPKLFFTHDLQKNGDINVQQIRSSDNPADLFTKSLPTSTLKKIFKIGMRRLLHLNFGLRQGE
ncbi:uncharacterized protein LOC132066085 [Lycium ferocissimum]|uniref:uncharacterized protein LOC132066085 n=1 Tax=Lycium ferocissimum TaxID=112874 RepID=UPI002814AE6E|nr:uncharacterized protein LOC132066085 [Lycium ferocissimum]